VTWEGHPGDVVAGPKGDTGDYPEGGWFYPSPLGQELLPEERCNEFLVKLVRRERKCLGFRRKRGLPGGNQPQVGVKEGVIGDVLKLDSDVGGGGEVLG
jgi:hypothetical protein